VLSQGTAMSVAVTEGHFGPATLITVVPAGASSPPASALHAASCVSASLCVAAGLARNQAGHPVAVAMIWTWCRWTAAFVRQPADATTGQF
jgi:hypothetical protein